MLLSVITFLVIVSSYSARLLPRDDSEFTDLQKQKADSPTNSYLLKRNFTASGSRSTQQATTNSTLIKQPKKWEVGQVTRKQYEIINLLWRKNKLFVNVVNTSTTTHYDPTSPSSSKNDNLTKKLFDVIKGETPFTFSARPPATHPFTPSYIEFYYSDDYEQQRNTSNSNCQLKNTEKSKSKIISTPNSSLLIFHLKGPLLTRTTRNYYSTSSSSRLHFNDIHTSNKLYKPVSFINKSILETKTHLVSPVPITNENTPEKNHSSCLIMRTELTQNYSDFGVTKHQTESTTVYDKIKFFEMYDKHTQVPFAQKPNMLEFDYENTDEVIELKNVDKILLEHVDQSSHQHNEAKHSKKHIVVNNKNLSQSCIEEKGEPKVDLLNLTTQKQNNASSYTNGSIVKSETRATNIYSYINKSVSWTKYPFAAVYVYEPSQVHCDAASISAHWLVASGSCLSRLNQSPILGDGRSAFVSYCSDSWWQPERVSYVKYSVVHPWYHPRDRTRRNLYNIGVIQVVTSMMSCSEWAPVTLMSHQFAVNQGGSEALALGWGLDRYDTRYAILDLPKVSLMIYKGLVFSDSCPGNIGYGKVKRLDEGGSLKNVYCLSLPPYSGEERDPVHGSLLLVGGKLIALYLQEERRPWGEQSAQYTGIWNLIPWVVEVAREPEEMESFTVEI